MTNQYILITGASTGIGKATALHLDSLGYYVFAGVRKEHDAQKLQELGSERLRPLLLDVTVPSQIDLAFKTVSEICGEAGLMTLINNAGFNYNAVFEFTEEEKARQMMETNFFGLYKMCQTFIPLLRQYAQKGKNSAKILNVGSIGSVIGLPWEAFYHASKFAVLSLTESLRFELHTQNIKCSAVLPGGILTDFIPKSEQNLAEVIKNLSESGKLHYAKGLAKIKNAITMVNRLGSPPEKVAKKMAKIIAKQNPKWQYLVGLDAKFIYFIVRCLPISWRHAFFRAQFA